MALDLTQASTPPATPAPHDLAAMAEEAHRLLGEDPARASELAGTALAHALGARLHETASVARRALGLAALDVDDAPTAVDHLRAAIASARRAGSAQRAAEARMSLAYALQHQGESGPALRQASLAMRDGGARDGRLAQQHALILERLGRMDEALEGYRLALTLVRRSGEAADIVAVLCNRGVLQAYRGALRAAEADLREAEQLALRIDQPLHAALVQANLGWIATLRGDLPAALASYDATEPLLAESSGRRRAVLEMDRCRALLSAGLQREAQESARRAVDLLAGSEMGLELAEARLALAEALLACGQPEAALAAAEQAGADFERQRRPGWAALAEHTAVRAAFARGSLDGELHARARRVGRTLAAAGWPSAALDAQLLAAHVALALGEDAAADLAAIPRARASGPVAQRLAAWHAEALRRLAAGRRGDASRALRAGLGVLEQHRLTLGATELRAGAAVHGNALASLGLRLALEWGRAEAVLEWGERGRAAALWQRPARPPDDAALAADLGELRTVLAAIGDAGKESGDTQPLLRRQTELEGAIRRRALHAGAASDPAAGAGATSHPTTRPGATSHPTAGAGATSHPTTRPGATSHPTAGAGATSDGAAGESTTSHPAAGTTSHPAARPSATPHPTARPGATPHPTARPGATSDGAAGAGGPPTVARLRAALGPRALVEFVQDDGRLCAVVVAEGSRPRLVALRAAGDEVAHELASLRAALRRLARGSGSEASLAVARSNAEHAAARLDELLLDPLQTWIGDRELVLVPTGELHAVPWAALPSCAARPLSVAPSAALWLRAARRRAEPFSPGATAIAVGAADGRGLVLVAGPGLPQAAAEVAALAARHPGATVLARDDASCAAVATALETARLAHIASHGTFRADNPLFSALELGDGPLTVYDLERLRAAPRDMVLSACDGGVTAVRPGDELMGLSSALLALGTSALTASVVPVPDEATHRLMLALHEHLADGHEPAPALARARADALGSNGADYATAAGFVCFGAGSAASG